VDTRTKIVSLTEALEVAERDQLPWVAGYFDPMTAAHVLELAKIGESLAVLVLDPPQALLPLRARAELAAALKVAKTVVALGDGEALDSLPVEPIPLQEGDLLRRDALVAHIKAKYALAHANSEKSES
jgi:hypothetical protein